MISRGVYIILILIILHFLLQEDVYNKSSLNLTLILVILNIYIIYKYDEKIQKLEEKQNNS